MMKLTLHHIRSAVIMTLLMAVLLCGAVPLLFTVVAQLLFPTASHGSLITAKDGTVIGSELLGQEFTQNKYFWGRLSATTPPYNAAASGASNLSMGNSLLLERANARMAKFPADKMIPLSLITSSASGLDPDISLLAAYYQIPRVAKARNMSQQAVEKIVQDNLQQPYLQLIGIEHVNVLKLNMALDAAHGK